MNKYIIEWRQLSEKKPCKVQTATTFKDVYHAVTLPLAIGQWLSKCYINAEIISVITGGAENE